MPGGAGPGFPSMIEQRRHVDEDRLQHTSPTTSARALSAGRLAPRRRHRLPNCLWCRFAVEGCRSRSPSHRTLDPMTSSSFEIRLETDGDAPALSHLSAEAFGPGRFTRSAYRVREGVPPVKSLCLCGLLDRKLGGRHPFHRDPHRRDRGGRAARAAGGRPGGERQRLWQGAGRGGLGAGARRRLCAGAARRRHALLRAVRLSAGAAGADQLCRARSIPRGCLPSSLFPARWPGPPARSKATPANGLRGTRSRPGSRAEGRARGSR